VCIEFADKILIFVVSKQWLLQGRKLEPIIDFII